MRVYGLVGLMTRAVSSKSLARCLYFSVSKKKKKKKRYGEGEGGGRNECDKQYEREKKGGRRIEM